MRRAAVIVALVGAISGVFGSPTGATPPVVGGQALGDVTTVAGGDSQGQVSDPFAIARFGSTLYIGNWEGYIVARDLTTGEQSLYAGRPGTTAYGGDGEIATDATFVHPLAMAVDAAGNLYVSERLDDSDCRVRRIDATTRVVSTVVGTGTCDFTGLDGVPALNAPYRWINQMVFGPDGRLFLASETSVFVLDLGTGIIAPLAGFANGYLDGPIATARFASVDGLAFDASGNLFVTDAANNAIREIDAAFTTVSTIAGGSLNGGQPAGFTDGPVTSAVFSLSTDTSHAKLAVGTDGDVFIGDNARIRRVRAGVVSTIIGDGTPGGSGDEGPGVDARIEAVRALIALADGALMISTEHSTGIPNQLRHIAADGVVTDATVVDGAPASEAPLSTPVDLVRVGTQLYVADSANWIWRIDLVNNLFYRFAGTGSPGSAGDGGPARDAQLNAPMAIASDGTALYVAGQDARIRRIGLADGIISTYAGTGNAGSGDGPKDQAEWSTYISGIAVARDGRMLVADAGNHRVRCIGCEGVDVVSTVAGTGTRGSSPDGEAALTADLVFPVRAAFAPDGSIVFADGCDQLAVLGPVYSGHPELAEDVCDSRVRRIDPATKTLQTVAGIAGDTGGAGDGGPASAASIRGPIALRYDAAGNLYIGELGGTFLELFMVVAGLAPPSAVQTGIRRVDHATGIITTVAGGNNAGFAGDGGPATAAQFFFPAAIAPDAGTHLFVADTFNRRVRRIEGARPNLVTTATPPPPVRVGAAGDLGISLHNAGTGYATGPVSVEITLPTGLRYLSVATPGWTCASQGQAVDCRAELNLAPDAIAGLRVRMRATGEVSGALSVNLVAISDSDDADPAAGARSVTVPVLAVGVAALHMVAADGGVFALGGAEFPGSLQGARVNAPVVGAAAPGAAGYWLVAADGGVFAFGDARFHGSLGGAVLNAPVVGIAATPSGDGYWLVAADGGVFAFGDARFHGSLGGAVLNAPVVGIAATPSGNGCWLVAADGGVFAFGDARFYGGLAGMPLNAPVVALVGTASGMGYRLVGADGGVFAYGDAVPVAGLATTVLNAPVVGAA